MLKLRLFYNYSIQVDIPNGTELYLINFIYIEYTASKTENIRTVEWETNGNLTNSELLADRTVTTQCPFALQRSTNRI